MDYFVTMIDFGRRGLQAVVEPEMTRSNVIDRITSGEYQRDRIAFIHHIHDGVCEVVTDELLEAVAVEADRATEDGIDRIRAVREQAARDHKQDQRKHYVEAAE